ncbi:MULTISPECIES: ATP-binding protein [Rhodopseudomonas]|uniref:histidine kinase n=1 Tax=Rhodopseudomonas palustris TaxID=1076 RepID=A0A0D7EIS2_RHOPL|nr:MULTISPECIES: ATP-binding protein [Rhodopseudomonas]KIZ39392.1 histidine kinase [Rhodopseudomonas palustris]MDF3809582.1 ATP-binding protein [Rhodopseudomonas sp. BAL398]WOK17778.1 ATP-binding protein [Rhodopseudomonas sp. BAL398]
MTHAPSLRFRLVIASLAWIVVSLAITGVLLVWLFRSHIEQRFDRTLYDHLEELAAGAEIGADGAPTLSWEPADPRFQPALSGWYWEILADGGILRASPSLSGRSLGVPGPGVGQPHAYRYVKGPAGENLRLIVQDIVLPGRPQPLTVLVAGPCTDIHTDVRRFAGNLALSLGVLGLTLGVLVLLQVGYGLRPLRHVRSALNAIRLGSRDQLAERDSPAEVLPLIQEINALLRQRQAMIERAREQAGDLAHALKTPIAVISNEAGQLDEQAGGIIKAEISKMRQAVEHHLVRARAAAGFRSPHARAALDGVLADVQFSLKRLYPERAITVATQADACFAGQADDLGEMIGNLADNAGKWARERIEIGAAVAGERLAVTIDDDGPGLDAAGRTAALARGGRLDTDKPGHGLGLSIVAHLAELYGGRLTLSPSPLGGLRAELDLPAG